MSKVFIDTNIIIDLLAKRQEYAETAEVFSLGDKGALTLLISSLSISHLHYILRKLIGDKTRSALQDLELIVQIASVDSSTIKLALYDESFTDFEDAIQYHCAAEHEADVIITRNLRDFKDTKIPVMTSSQFINSLAR
ncbi:PIN domain-containing protein [Lewinella sp. 4G2]|uniref:type II toxin-antitoxin system VapC family toxin n=1 Tax=Lewinella sp. 4G2 TaxID=1803372 RepID=UPI0007B4708E|nr:PIN domain-containing protein [Lewinella sp. 4G2]OAV43935.1 hypothetical protein A3850_005255 [Lewinella sp. 4G2]